MSRHWSGSAGFFDLVRYFALKAAVVRVMNGRRRVESDRFVALRSHYMFDSSFCHHLVEGRTPVSQEGLGFGAFGGSGARAAASGGFAGMFERLRTPLGGSGFVRRSISGSIGAS
jgi:hypothetical protein